MSDPNQLESDDPPPWVEEVRLATRPTRYARKEPKVPFPLAMAIAGMAYVVLMAIGLTAWELLVALIRWDGSIGGKIGDALLLCPGAVAPFTMVAGVAMLFLSVPVWGMVVVVAASLQARWDDAQLAAHAGGWTAMAAMAGLMILFLDSPHAPSGEEMVGCGILGPGIAIPTFQFAGAWSHWPRRQERRPRRTRQFGLGQLLWATTWIALALAILKLTGWLTPRVLTFLFGSMVYQWATQRLVMGYCRRQHERQTDSKAASRGEGRG